MIDTEGSPRRDERATFDGMKDRLLYVTDATGEVLAVQVTLADWIQLLERICDLEAQLRPESKLDKRLDAVVRRRVGNKKKVSLDDIGFVGTGREMTRAEQLLVSTHIAMRKAEKS